MAEKLIWLWKHKLLINYINWLNVFTLEFSTTAIGINLLETPTGNKKDHMYVDRPLLLLLKVIVIKIIIFG